MSAARVYSFHSVGHSPIPNGTSATLPCKTSFCGSSRKNTPSAWGMNGVFRAYNGIRKAPLACFGAAPLTWNPRNVGVLFMAAVMASAGAWRRHSSTSFAEAHPVSDAMKSKVGCSLEKSPEGRADPDSIHPARKRPSVWPPFVTIWNATDWLPALSPHLIAPDGVCVCS